MKRISISLVVFVLIMITQTGWSQTQFKFPEKIQFKLLKNDRVMGSCNFQYKEKSERKGFGRNLSYLKMGKFQAFGLTLEDVWYTYIFRDTLSVYSDSAVKKNEKKPFVQIELKEGIRFDMGKGQVFIYREKNSKRSVQTELFTKHKVISFLSCLFIASRRVALGEHQQVKPYNLIIEKSTKIVEMKYLKQEKAPFLGKMVPVEVILLTNPNNKDMEVIRMRIFKDSEGYCFPVSILYNPKQQDSFEMRADKVQNKG